MITIVVAAETVQSSDNGSVAVMPAAAQSSLAFTIDFGQNSDKPEITDHWKQLTPYRVHSGVQQRSSATKSRSTGKQHTDCDVVVAGRKTNKVFY